MKGIYLLLGSNLGNSREILKKAIVEIENDIGEIVKSSSVYKTKAWGIEDQPDFLNQVVEIESSHSPQIILKRANKIEEKLGRVRRIKWHSRIIDIDILYYGNEIVNTDKLVIPHPENQNRNFVLVPICEIAADLIHPALMFTQKEMLENCADKLDVKKIL
ncbi:MAG: 2-amino-4-hydroxy-6-hydroxymethyldihydropteridine diphosphokinase [Cyclobacteriaceae bacterium]|nr:2-amino-4-hydroxy-6-hydroxymethyldihydropteridine diphosphokinase [Cyclobacteriaceae bacterium]